MKSTFLKVMAIICLVLGIIGLVASVFALLGAGMLAGGVGEAIEEAGLAVGEDVVAVAAAASGALLVASIVLIIESILMILAGVFGMKASSNPAKLGGAMVMGIIMVALGVISLIMSATSGTITWQNFTSLIIPVLYLVAVFLFKKKAASAQ